MPEHALTVGEAARAPHQPDPKAASDDSDNRPPSFARSGNAYWVCLSPAVPSLFSTRMGWPAAQAAMASTALQ